MIDCNITSNYFKEKKRMTKTKKYVCEIDCDDCPLSSSNNGIDISCASLEANYPNKAIEIVQKWSDGHPQKTFLTDFLEKYPNAPLEENGTPRFCPYDLDLGYMTKEDCYMMTKEDFDDCSQYCKQCWNTSIKN